MASSSASCKSKYDVFLSFRGEDTRKTFVSHLYAALTSKGIVTFKDDKKLEVGDHISDRLRGAIEGSRFALVVLSENYATSRWCLIELQLIMERMKHGKLVVFPVFYEIDPSAVRHQRGSFALERYRSPEMADTVLQWEEALNLIANLSGVDSRICNDESIMVGNIVTDIAKRLTLMRKKKSENIFGIEAQMEGLSSLFDLKSYEVRMIGIWGMGGIGKTTIAKHLYEEFKHQFRAHCFIENVKSICKDHGQNLRHLQKLVFSRILNEDTRLWSVKTARRVIEDKFGILPVFIVLDDVDKVAQVHAMAEETSWFGPGSQIIITTRDWGLLNSCGVKTVYKVKCLDGKDSLQMFNHIAFGEGLPPPEGFEQLSVRASQLAHGLPSALQAYALFLRGRTAPKDWEKALGALEINLDKNMMKVLKMSYKDLPKPHQNVLLHIACLFNGDTLQRITSLLDGSRPERSTGMRVLVEKSLIEISTNRYVTMPKLVEKMGREIMHGFRKYLGDPVDVFIGTQQTECMSLHMCGLTCALSMNTSDVSRMYNLKFLKVYKHVDCRESKLRLISDSLDLPRTIRLLHWDAFPLRTFPFRFDPYLLVELNLRDSNLETLWSREKVLKCLKILDVTGSKYLKRLPNLSNATTLEELILERCPRLEGISECIGKRSSLKKLKLSSYGGYRGPLRVVIWKPTEQQPIRLELPDLNIETDKIISISIKGDIRVEFFPYFQGDADNISFNSEPQIPITLRNRVQQTPQLISEFSKFNFSINITRFSQRVNCRPFIFGSSPDFPNLKELKLVNLNIWEIPNGISHLEFIEKLDLSGNDFVNLPEAMNSLSCLRTLWLQDCLKLKELPDLTQVQTLKLSNCRNLRSLVKLSHASRKRGKYCLLELLLENCNSVEALSDQLGHFTMLTYLDLSSHNFETLPSSIRDLTSLVTLCLSNCKKLHTMEGLPPSLQFLNSQGCDSLGSFTDG